MTEAGWTSNAPTKEGWYWWQRTENDNPVVVWVNAFHPDKQLRAEMISGRRELLTHFNGLFKGPLSPTDRQQGRVEGLREAEDYAEQCVKERQLQLLNLGDQAALDPNDRRPGWIRCKASEARRIQVWCARQTQQAQEGGVGE